jgi:hypothetical protein
MTVSPIMKRRKVVRVFLWSAGALLVATVTVYLLRWPLFGGTVRSRLAELVGKELNSDPEVGSLRGSLVSSITAENVVLKPRADAPFKSATAERIRVVYGFLGSGEPTLTVENARIVIAPKDGPAPPLHESIRDVVSVLRSLRFSGTVQARKVDVVLPDGRTLALQEGSLNHATWTLILKTEGFGTVEGTATLRVDGSFVFDGKASDGPISSAKIELGGGRDRCPMALSTELRGGQPLTWAGTAFFEADRLVRVEGDLSVKEGRARTVADFKTGRLEADVDGVLAVNEELKGDLALTGRAEGPMEGPREKWTVREATIRTRGAKFRSVVIDDAEIKLGQGSLAEISFDGTARSGKDRVQAGGFFRWKGKPDFDATVRAEFDDAAPWLPLLPKLPDLQLAGIKAEGQLSLHDAGVSFDGSGSTGPGSVEGVDWKELTFKGAFTPGRVELREGTITGNSRHPGKIDLTGKFEGEEILVRLKAGVDEADLGGRLQKNGDFEGRIRVEGPLEWAGLPVKLTRVSVAGKIRREKDDIHVMLDVSEEKKLQMSLEAAIRQHENEWWIALAPGSVAVEPRRRIDYSEVLLKITPEKVSADNLKLVCSETLVARVTVDRATHDVVPELRWGKEDGDHVRVSGRWGKELDLSAVIRAKDLKRPLLRHLFPGIELEGAVSLDAHVTGTPAEPKLSGTLNLSKITTAALPPLSLVIPLSTEGRRLRLWTLEPKTPYGEVELDGSFPLAADAGPIDLTLRVATDDFTPLLERVNTPVRAWIPHGGLTAQVYLTGPLESPRLGGRAEFFALKFKPPDPLPLATDIRLSARLDESGVVIEMADGLLGKGPFWASGSWNCFEPNQPLTLWVTGQDVLVVDDPLARLRVRPDALLTWDARRGLKLSGRLEVPLLIYHREFGAATPGVHGATRQVAAPRLRLIPAETGGFLIPGIGEGLEALELDLKLSTPGEVRIENSTAGILVSVDGQLTGTATDPALSGRIRSRPNRGEVKLAPGTFMRIESAEAWLPEEAGRPPTVTFHGRVGTGEGAIQINVEGPLDNPSLSLKSDPPMSQKDLLGRLAFGIAPGAVSGETGVATLAVYLYDQAKDDWPNADRREGFFDRIRPTVIPGDSSQQRRVPWELPPTGTLRSTSLRTEYVYNYYFSIIGETNREGDVGGDLKLKIRF